MPCYRPLDAFQCVDGVVVFSEQRKHDVVRRLTLACGQCIGCRLERSRQWAVRCMHEKQMHTSACFITVTYSDDQIPEGHELRHEDWQAFAKRLRQHIEREHIRSITSQLKLTNTRKGFFAHSDKPAVDKNSPSNEIDQKKGFFRFPKSQKFKINFRHTNLRFYMAGEYGEQTKRPHYHAAIFGYDFPDKKHWRQTRGGPLYTSTRLDKLWRKGFTTIGELTFESAAYIARYITSKISGTSPEAKAKAKAKYEYIDEHGEIKQRKKEYNRMSLRPAIGATWLQKYTADVYPEGIVIARGHKSTAPRYYDKKYADAQPLNYEDMKWLRQLEGEKRSDDNTPERLRDKEKVKLAAITTLRRRQV